MKAQMKFQKILTLVSLIVSVLAIVYALIFFTGNLADLMSWDSRKVGIAYYTEAADDFIDAGQTFVGTLVVLGIIFLCSVLLLYVTATNKRRNYYITNYIAVGVFLAMALAVAVYIIIGVTLSMVEFVNIDWDDLNLQIAKSIEAGKDVKEITQNPAMFILGYVVSVIVLADGVVYALNLVWKIKLMKGEKALLEAGMVKEVA